MQFSDVIWARWHTLLMLYTRTTARDFKHDYIHFHFQYKALNLSAVNDLTYIWNGHFNFIYSCKLSTLPTTKDHYELLHVEQEPPINEAEQLICTGLYGFYDLYQWNENNQSSLGLFKAVLWQVTSVTCTLPQVDERGKTLNVGESRFLWM